MEFFNYLRTQNEYLKKFMESNPSLASLLSETKLMTSTSFNYEEVFKDSNDADFISIISGWVWNS